MMRGDALLHLRLVRRPRGLLGLGAAAAGVAGLVSAYLPWYEVAARLDMLGASQSRALAGLAGWEAQPWGWLVPALSIAAVITGAGIAVDRPPPRPRDLALGAAAGLGASAALAGISFPPVARFDVAGSRLRELAGLSGRLPDDVELSFAVRPAVGLWLAAAAAAVLALSALALHLRR